MAETLKSHLEAPPISMSTSSNSPVTSAPAAPPISTFRPLAVILIPLALAAPESSILKVRSPISNASEVENFVAPDISRLVRRGIEILAVTFQSLRCFWSFMGIVLKPITSSLSFTPTTIYSTISSGRFTLTPHVSDFFNSTLTIPLTLIPVKFLKL